MFHMTMNLGELSELILIPFCPYTRFIPNIYPMFFQQWGATLEPVDPTCWRLMIASGKHTKAIENCRL